MSASEVYMQHDKSEADRQHDKPNSDMKLITSEVDIQCERLESDLQHNIPIIDLHPDASESGTRWPVVSFMLLNTALGIGILNYPYAYSKAGGICISTFVQLLVVALTFCTMLVLIYCSELSHSDTYQQVLFSMCGRMAEYLAMISILLSCYGICITNIVVIGDQYNRLFLSLYGENYCSSWYINRKFVTTITAVVTILPTCYFRRLNFLKYLSTFGCLIMVYVVSLTIYEYYIVKGKQGEIVTVPENALDTLVMMTVFSFAYQTHEIIIPIYVGLKHKTIKTFAKATILALGLLFLLYCLAGSYGYLTFGSHVTPDIMDLYDAKDPSVMIAIIVLIMKMIATYPLLVVCGRSSVDDLYAKIFSLQTPQLILHEFSRRVIISSLWFITTILIAIFTPNIGIILELLGCLASLNVYIFPGLCLMSLGFKQSRRLRTWSSKVLFTVSCVFITFGALVFCIVLVRISIYGVPAPKHTNSSSIC